METAVREFTSLTLNSWDVGVTIVRPSLWQIDFDRIGDLDS